MATIGYVLLGVAALVLVGGLLLRSAASKEEAAAPPPTKSAPVRDAGGKFTKAK